MRNPIRIKRITSNFRNAQQCKKHVFIRLTTENSTHTAYSLSHTRGFVNCCYLLSDSGLQKNATEG